MDINKLLSGVNCSCGKVHTCDINYVYIEKGAISYLKEICEKCKNVLIVADENTFSAAGEKTVAVLIDKQIKTVIFTGRNVLVPDEDAINTVTENLKDIDMIVGIGSGVIQDLCKYVSFESKIPYIIVATAPSMDGYASDGAAMITGGMKVTYKAGLPRAIIADTDVLCNAPIDMIKAGYGDIIGKFSALNDWKLSKCVNDEYFCDYIYNLTMEQIERTLKLASGILERNEESIKTLMEALVIIGILMSFAGSSRPASGSEHHLSHFFEITGIIDNTEYFPHGIDVAHSTVITAGIREKILADKFPSKIFRDTREIYESKIKSVYKQVADGCIELQDKVGNYANDRIKVYLEKETEIKKILEEMPASEDISDMLSLVGLDVKEFYSLYGKEKIEKAILYAKDLKDRYTVLWINYDFYGNEKNV
ncbi:MAG: sn-glycerol-1-phosphate dehydrogenase [Acutalibacteraceae bacterium]|nr:sn-glycerol-1-phosphate dehydrogenase [Acutalibacteraceae bacterium]